MKTEVRNEFILEAHKSACNEWKLKIEKECPELFKTKLEVGKWYKAESHKALVFIDKKTVAGIYGYGFDYIGNYTNQWNAGFPLNSDYTLATEKEVKEALIKEAKKIGLNYNVMFKSINGKVNKIDDSLNFNLYDNCLYLGNRDITGVLFKNGKWAKIILNPIEEIINDLQKELDELKKQL